MNSSTKDALLALGKCKDAGKIAFCLNSLSKESPDDDFCAILNSALLSLSDLKKDTLVPVGAEIKSALQNIAETIGHTNYLQMVSRLTSKPTAHLPMLLSVIGDSVSNADYEPLLEIAKWPNIPQDSCIWLAQQAHNATSPQIVSLLAPFLRLLIKNILDTGSLSQEQEQIIQSISANNSMTEALSELLKSEYSDDVQLTAGAILIIGYTANPTYVPLVGPFIEDIGAWNRLLNVLLNKDRLRGLFDRASKSGLRDALIKCWQESTNSGKDFTTSLAEDREVQRSIARMLSSRSTFLAICRTLVDPAIIGVLKDMFFDTYLPCRKAASVALSHFRTDAATPFLKIGLVDRDNQVRETCTSTLKHILGQDKFDELVKEMVSETTSLRENLKELSGWAQKSLSELGSGLSSAFDAVQTSASWLVTKTKTVFERKSEKAND